MRRNSFIEMAKLHDLSGRITYISSHVKQEHLYEVYATEQDRAFWREFAKCNQEEFEKNGANGKCIEARERMGALTESFINYDHDYLLKKMVDEFKEKYGVECFAALHHNKRKTRWKKGKNSTIAVKKRKTGKIFITPLVYLISGYSKGILFD